MFGYKSHRFKQAFQRVHQTVALQERHRKRFVEAFKATI